jgi:hypothetical protein
MFKLPQAIHVAILSLVIGAMMGLIALAQRLGDWRSKFWARVLGGLAGALTLSLLYLLLLWVFGLDMIEVVKQHQVLWSAAGIVSVGGIVAALCPNKRISKQEIRVELADGERIHKQLVDEYCAQHPEVADKVRAGMMPQDLSVNVLTWMRGRLEQMGYPPGMIKLHPVVEPPAGIRIRHAKGLVVNNSDIEMTEGLSAIDAQHIEDSSITNTRIRIPKPEPPMQ